MTANITSVSKFERRAIFLFALIASLFVASLFIEEAVYQYREAAFERQRRSVGISFSRDDFGRRTPAGLSLLVPLIAVALVRPRRFWISTGLTAVCSILFVIGCYLRVASARELGFLNPIRDAIDWGDYVFGAFLLVMLVWQFSILRRLSAHKHINSLP